MKKYYLCFQLALSCMALLSTGCQRDKYDSWEDTKTAGRHVSRGISALLGNDCHSRQVRNKGDFECYDENGYPQAGYQDCDYVPLEDLTCDDVAMADMVARPPRETPGDPGSSIPGIEAFSDPSTNPQLAGVFKNIYFEYNSSMVKGSQNLQVVHDIANYMRSHPRTYIFVEGHTDERGPQAYNLALGSRRANAVRNLLINEGVDPDHLFTISYGKERPLVMEQHEEGWSKNRRAEFKTYEK